MVKLLSFETSAATRASSTIGSWLLDVARVPALTYALSAEVATYLVGGAGLIWSSSDIALDDHWHLTAALACTLLAGTLRAEVTRR